MRGVRASRVLAACIGVVASFGVLELALRVAPGELIPLKLLRRFHPEVRLAIARQIGLPNASQVRTLARDDGGPALQLRVPHAEVLYDFRDGRRAVFRMDEQGFCNAPGDRYDRDTIDLLVVGDSFTECVASDPAQTWPSRLGAVTGLTQYNLGKGGIGPYEYLQILRHFGLPKRPTVVVMNLYEGNDLRDALAFHDYREAARSGRAPRQLAGDRNSDPFDYEAALDHPLGRTSRALDLLVVGAGQLWEVASNALRRSLRGEPLAEIDFRYTLHLPDGDVPFNVQNADASEVRVARALRAGDVSLAAFDEALVEFAALARAHGFRPVVSYAPSAHTAYAPFVEFRDPSLAELLHWFSAEQRRWLAERCAALGLAFVDLVPAFQAAARERGGRDLLHHPIHVHYTESGHELAARAVAEALGSSEERHASQGDGVKEPSSSAAPSPSGG